MSKLSVHTTQKFGIVMSILLLSLLLVNTKEASSDTVNPGVYSPDSKPFGLTYSEWTAKWWQWFIKIPNIQHPFGDTTGEKCSLMQNGPVWFLVGSAGKVERDCTISSDKAILIPIINTECSYSESPNLKTKQDLTNCAVEGQTNAQISASLDNRSIVDPKKYRITTDIFNVTYADDPVFPTNSKVSEAVSDGWYLFLEPMQKGQHDIKVMASQVGGLTEPDPTSLIDVTYHITIE